MQRLNRLINRNNIYCFVLFSLLIFQVVRVYPQTIAETITKEDEEWVIYEKGLKEMKNGEHGNALYLFKLCLQKRKDKAETAGLSAKIKGFPEVEMSIGDIYKQVEPLLAEKQYRKAYELKNDLYIYEQRYTVLYKLAELYKEYFHPPMYGKAKETFLEIIKEDDEKYFKNVFLRYKELFLKTFKKKGLNKLLHLYRLENKAMAQAHSALGWLYYIEVAEDNNKKIENITTAIKHYLFNIVIILSEAIEEVLCRNYDYRYDGLNSFFDVASQDEQIKNYLKEYEIFKNLYYLGAAIYIYGDKEKATDVFILVKNAKDAGRYGILARNELEKLEDM